MRLTRSDGYNRVHLRRMAVSLGVVTGFQTDGMPDSLTKRQYQALIESFLDCDNRRKGGGLSAECLLEVWERIRREHHDHAQTGTEAKELIVEYVEDGEECVPGDTLRKPALQAVAVRLAYQWYEAGEAELAGEETGFLHQLTGGRLA